MTAYYNECDPYAAQWIRNLIRAGLVAPGEVDERSIEDVSVLDLAGFRQVHMFAGIAGWSLALRQAGIPDDREVWTGSCPCQPFSAAGKRGGFDDERHLWPAFYGLIAARRPAAIVGEQVASQDGLKWLDALYTDLESANYAVRAADLCAAGVGAPHIRQRLYWMADAGRTRLERRPALRQRAVERAAGARGVADGLADAAGARRRSDRSRRDGGNVAEADRGGPPESGRDGGDLRPGPTNGFWRAADWLYCRDDKWRPIEPGLEPLVDGASARIGRMRAYGNAICIPVAVEFIRAVMA